MMLLKFKCITVLAFLIVECYVLSLSAWLNIERGDRDVFDNPNCDSPTGGGCRNCDGLKATCVGNCKRCKCSETYRTFLPSYATNGQCVKNRRLLFLSPNASFLVERISSKCMKPDLKYRHYIVRTSCDTTDSSQRWIWTRNKQLMHADTLQCLERGPRYSAVSAYWYLVLGKCISTDTEQRWQCHGNANFISIKWKLPMYLDNSNKYIYGIDNLEISQWKNWRRFPSNQRLCSKAFGCYDFVTALSAVLVTDARQCPQQCLEKREIYVPYKSEESLCFVNWGKLQYLDNYNWKQLPFRDEIFTIDNRNQRIYLQINFTKATNDWTGLIVKLNFYCAKKNLSQVNVTDTKCVVIKFKGTSIDPPTVKPTKVPTTPSSTSTSPEKTTSTTQDPTNDTNSTATVMTDTKLITNYQITSSTSTSISPTGAAEKHKSDSSNVTIIAVCVVIAILILCGILGFVFYKRRRHSVMTAKSKEGDSPATQLAGDTTRNPIYSPGDTNPGENDTYQEPQTDASINPIYSPVDDNPTSFFSGDEATYQEPQTGASQECELYEPCGNNVYDQCADVEQNGKHTPPHEHAYDYAKSEDVRPVAQRL